MAEPLSGRDREGTAWELPGAPPALPVRSRHERAMPASRLSSHPVPACPLWARLILRSPAPGTGWVAFCKAQWGINKLLGLPAPSSCWVQHPRLCCVYRCPLTRRPLLPAPGRYHRGCVPKPVAEDSVPADRLNSGDNDHRCSREPAGSGTWRSRRGAVPWLRPVCRAVPDPCAAVAGSRCSLPGTWSHRGPSPWPDHADGKLQPGR